MQRFLTFADYGVCSISYIVHNRHMTVNDFPAPAEIRRIREWCQTRRGAVARIAELVIQHDGTRGINHSAVSRTLAGRERNSLVIAAFRKLLAAPNKPKKRLKLQPRP